MSVTLRDKINKDGTNSLYLDIYHNKKRYKEYLKECKLENPSNALAKQGNKAKKELAKRIAIKRAEELESNGYNVLLKHKGQIDIFKFFDNFIKNYDKKDLRNVIGVCNKFKEFTIKNSIRNLSIAQLDENIVYSFSQYLKKVCTGEGASSYYARFKKIIKQAIREKLILDNPCIDVKIKKDYSIRKDILSIDDIQKLYTTEISNINIKNAFLFSCFTGLRWADIVTLKWSNIDLENKILKKYQTKTDTLIDIPISENALNFLPENDNTLVYQLTSHTGALKTLKNWVKKAGINKHITWHCARHSFITNLAIFDVQAFTIQKLAGHASITETQRYITIADEMKRKAVNKMPSINK